MSELSDAVNSHSPGDKVAVTFYRGKDRKTVTVKLGNRPDQQGDATSGSRDGTQ